MDRLFASIAALALAGSSVAVPSVAMSSEPGTAASPDSPQSTDDELLDRYEEALANRNLDDALAFATRLRPDNPTGKAIAAAMRARVLIGLKRNAEARSLIAEADRLAPQSPEPSRVMFMGALIEGQMDFAADALDRLIARFPDAARAIDWDSMSFFIQEQPTGDPNRNDDRLIALAQIGYGGDTEQGHWLASDAVDALVRRNNFPAAEKLLGSVRELSAVRDMLIDRRFAPLWPKLEELAGPHVNNLRKASVASAQDAYMKVPDDHERLAQYVNALRNAGRSKDAIALRTKLPQTAEAMSSADEQMGWAINNVAYALHQAGRADDADQLFASLIDVPIPNDFWRISMKINRLELLVHDGRFDKALPLIEPTATTKGTAYADQLIRRLRYCTLTRLGRADEAAKYVADMMAHAKDAPGATFEGLLCAGEVDKAEAFALAFLKNPDEKKRLSFEKDFLHYLQGEPLDSDEAPVWQEGFKKLKQRPAIAAAFDKLGRDMPAALLPPKPDTGAK